MKQADYQYDSDDEDHHHHDATKEKQEAKVPEGYLDRVFSFICLQRSTDFEERRKVPLRKWPSACDVAFDHVRDRYTTVTLITMGIYTTYSIQDGLVATAEGIWDEWWAVYLFIYASVPFLSLLLINNNPHTWNAKSIHPQHWTDYIIVGFKRLLSLGVLGGFNTLLTFNIRTFFSLEITFSSMNAIITVMGSMILMNLAYLRCFLRKDTFKDYRLKEYEVMLAQNLKKAASYLTPTIDALPNAPHRFSCGCDFGFELYGGHGRETAQELITHLQDEHKYDENQLKPLRPLLNQVIGQLSEQDMLSSTHPSSRFNTSYAASNMISASSMWGSWLSSSMRTLDQPKGYQLTQLPSSSSSSSLSSSLTSRRVSLLENDSMTSGDGDVMLQQMTSSDTYSRDDDHELKYQDTRDREGVGRKDEDCCDWVQRILCKHVRKFRLILGCASRVDLRTQARRVFFPSSLIIAMYITFLIILSIFANVLDVAVLLASLTDFAVDQLDTFVQVLNDNNIDGTSALNTLRNFIADVGRILPPALKAGFIVAFIIICICVYTTIRHYHKTVLTMRLGKVPKRLRGIPPMPVTYAPYFVGYQVSAALASYIIQGTILTLIFFLLGWDAFWKLIFSDAIMSYLIAFVSSLVLIKCLDLLVGRRILSDDNGMTVKYGSYWTQYSLVILVQGFMTGIFGALTRLVYLFALSVISLSRMDTSLFPKPLKMMDTSWVSFMQLIIFDHRNSSPAYLVACDIFEHYLYQVRTRRNNINPQLTDILTSNTSSDAADSSPSSSPSPSSSSSISRDNDQAQPQGDLNKNNEQSSPNNKDNSFKHDDNDVADDEKREERKSCFVATPTKLPSSTTVSSLRARTRWYLFRTLVRFPFLCRYRKGYMRAVLMRQQEYVFGQ